MGGRASIVGAALTHVGNVREHNEDAFFFDEERGMFLVCDGMGGHAAGEVASAIAVKTIRERWTDAETQEVADIWLARGTAIAKKQLLAWLRDGVIAAHNAIIAEAERDPSKSGMGTTLVGGIVVGSELLFAHAGDSRAYIVRDGIAMQLTEDHTLLQRLLSAGIDVDVTGDGARFRSMLTNALGIGQECKVSTFVVPLADGDRFMLCSDGISEYVQESEVGEVLTKQPSPARAAQKLVDMALERGGGDNATTIVVRVLEAGENPVPSEQRRRDDLSISLCELWTEKVSPQQRLRALRIAIPRDHAPGDKLPAHTLGDRVAWIIVEGEVLYEREEIGPGSLIYPESLVADAPVPDKDGLAIARTEVRAVAIRNDDWRELCEEDAELGEALHDGLGNVISARQPSQVTVVDRAFSELGIPEDEISDADTMMPDEAPASPPHAASVPPSDAGESAIDRAIEGAMTAPAPRVLSRSNTPEAQALGRATTPVPVELSEPEIRIEQLEGAPTQDPDAAKPPPRQPRPPTEPEIEISYGSDDDAAET